MAKTKASASVGEGHNVDLAEKSRKVLFFINRKDYLEAQAANGDDPFDDEEDEDQLEAAE